MSPNTPLFSTVERLIPGLMRRTPAIPFAPPRRSHPLCVVGDIHGRLDLLERLLDQIDQRGTCDLLFVGDVLDRGPDSAAALDRVHGLCRDGRATCLMGNHERMCLDALDAPTQAGARWLEAGGDMTLASFGLDCRPARGVAPHAWQDRTLRALRAALPPGQEAWLRTLPLWWQDGPLAVVHAAADPRRPLPKQRPEVLLWGHRRFTRQLRQDGVWVIHGHTVVDHATAAQGRIAVDTGAWTSGRLTAAWIDAEGLTFLEA
ncbi:bis(5'-nucleosyl)-tetraphosphatase [Jannaschia sp. AI_61]|uniref:metallophosphoesterase n=1 Tax=Jannaschia sp. AI_61 TaxID=2829796 RepID=UPI001BBFA84D|nr:metallophosphoesterase [Jannaschia sp. AI_61]GIT93298.1 bis(5'-nucleosyl)-tetraphosphatase [Jannaschia sp. AI_61]